MGSARDTEDIVVVGIDFGTTFSGVAWAYSGDPDSVEVVTSWDSEFNHCSDLEKAPTQLCFGTQNDATTWGYGVPQHKEAIRWFKLLLLDKKDVPNDAARSSQLPGVNSHVTIGFNKKMHVDIRQRALRKKARDAKKQ